MAFSDSILSKARRPTSSAEAGPRTAAKTERGSHVPPVVHDVLRQSGQPLDAGTRAFFEPRFGADFGGVRVHTGAKAAASAEAVGGSAFTVGQAIAFNAGRYSPGTAPGLALLAHELAHTLQQGSAVVPAPQVSVGRRGEPHERNAGAVARAALHGGPMPAVQPDRPTLRRDDPGVIDVDLAPVTPEGREEAKKLGIELPAVSMETWFQIGGGWYQDTLGKTAASRPISVYYFPGQTDERALVIGGVHGSELSGIETAELLVERLKTATTKPYYTVAVVPCLFPDNRALAESQPKSIGTAANVGRYTMTGNKRGKDPNRQFPDLGKAFDPKNPTDAKGVAIEPENVMLLQLFERFHPTRIASVHATRPENGKDASGIYADPKTDEKGVALGPDADQKLAIRMAERAKQGGANVPGNKLAQTPTALYPLDEPLVAAGTKQPRTTKEGVSLGGWGSTAVGGGRPAMTVITMEMQTANPSLKPGDPEVNRNQQRLKELQAHAIAIQEIFLGPP